MTLETAINVEQSPRGSKASDYLSARANNDPLLYPGERPESSYVTDGDSVYMADALHDESGNLIFNINRNGESVPMDDYLIENGVPTMDERIPILAFGANVSPSSIAAKFAKIGRPDALIIPTVYAKLPGKDIVWSTPGLAGNPVAILYEGEETKQSEVQVAINFLTPEQVLVMHQSEVTYDLSSVDVDVDGQKVRTFYYAGRNNIYLRDGHPVAIDSITADGREIPALDAAGALDEIINTPSVKSEIDGQYPDLSQLDARTYVEFVQSLATSKDSTDRQTLKSLISDTLTANGNARYTELKDASATRESWANPSTLPTLGDQKNGVLHPNVYRLPSQELSNWKDGSARALTLRSVTNHLIRMSGGELKVAETQLPKK
jgi:hypothetical protein